MMTMTTVVVMMMMMIDDDDSNHGGNLNYHTAFLVCRFHKLWWLAYLPMGVAQTEKRILAVQETGMFKVGGLHTVSVIAVRDISQQNICSGTCDTD
jgi:hypothetical protein